MEAAYSKGKLSPKERCFNAYIFSAVHSAKPRDQLRHFSPSVFCLSSLPPKLLSELE